MNLIIGIIVGLIVLTILVALHELGHALAAKHNGVKLEEFGIGFPPNVWSFKTKTNKVLPKGTKVSINWIPLGGFVKLQGEHDSDNKKGDYGKATFWGKTQILFAGVIMNWLVSIVIFTILAIVGLPKLIPNQFYIKEDAKIIGGEITITDLKDGMPAKESGLEKGDQILAINGEKIESPEQISILAKNNVDKDIDFKIKRNNNELIKRVHARKDNADGKGFLGTATTKTGEKIYSTWSAPVVGFCTTFQLTGETFKTLGDMVSNLFTGLYNKVVGGKNLEQKANEQISKAGEGVAGPVMIIGQIFPQATQSGLGTILLLMAIISLSLACMNVLPIPALDGGRWLQTFIFRKLLKKPLTAEIEEKINGYGFLFLMSLSLLIIVLDIIKIS